jgi:hypothetical protein
MNDDRWLQELAQIKRDQEADERSRLDERWDLLSSGELSAEEEAELRTLAATSEEAREAYEAFRPLGPEFQARVVEAARAQLVSSIPQPKPQELWAKLLTFLPAAPRIEVWFGSAAAVAAALFLFLHTTASLSPLPVYTADLSPGDQNYRGGESRPANGSPSLFFPGSLLTLSVSPKTTVTDKVAARAFLSPSAGVGDIQPWKPEPHFETLEGGSVRLSGTLGQDIQLSTGYWTVWVAVSKRKLPSTSELQEALLAGRTQHEDWKAVCDAVRARQIRHDQWQVTCANLRVEVQPPS